MRKNILNLSTAEWNAVVAALNAMKANGKYDGFTQRHMTAMMDLTLYPGETGTQRNVAHRGPAIFPWHRELMLEFEAALGMSMPYWNWEATGLNWQTSGVWSMVGGNGRPSSGYRITSGPFAGWTSTIYRRGTFVPRTGIVRQWRSQSSMNPVPTSIAAYDSAPWNENTDPSRSFRELLENAHNNVHDLIGGDMDAGTSPNDPVFWLHHSNVDRIFWRWQERHGFDDFQPVSGAPTGHNRGDIMKHLLATKTIDSVLDPRTLGISYDTLG